jgi:hypothetical protein
MFGWKVDPKPQTMGGRHLGAPLEESVMILDDHAGPVISGGDAVTTQELGVIGVKGAALRENPLLPMG